jgi:hypothetical protein
MPPLSKPTCQPGPRGRRAARHRPLVTCAPGGRPEGQLSGDAWGPGQIGSYGHPEVGEPGSIMLGGRHSRSVIGRWLAGWRMFCDRSLDRHHALLHRRSEVVPDGQMS